MSMVTTPALRSPDIRSTGYQNIFRHLGKISVNNLYHFFDGVASLTI
jgi:hypothetical protein